MTDKVLEFISGVLLTIRFNNTISYVTLLVILHCSFAWGQGTSNRALFAQYNSAASSFEAMVSEFQQKCPEHMETVFAEECKDLARRIQQKEQQMMEFEADVRSQFRTEAGCEPVESNESFSELVTESARAINGLSCTDAEKETNKNNCAKEVMCMGVSSVLGLAANGYELLAKALPQLPTDCVNSDNNCMTHVVTALLKSVWSLITGVWDLVKMAANWVGDKIVNLYDWAVGAEDASTNAQLALDNLNESQFDQIKRDPAGFFLNLFKTLWEGIKEWLKTDVFCEQWEGVPHFGTCVKPYTDFECMSCRTAIAGTCAAAGVIIAEVVPSFLTGGGLAAVKWGGKGASVFAKFVKGSSAYRKTARLVEGMADIRAIKLAARLGETVTRTVTRTRKVLRFVIDPALNLMKRGFNTVTRRIRSLKGTSLYRATAARLTWFRNTPLVKILERLNNAHTRLHRAVFHAGESLVDDAAKRITVRRGARAASTVERAAIRNSPEAVAFRQAYSEIRLGTNNSTFFAKMNAAVPTGKEAIFFDVENAVLKQLNDVVFAEKSLGDAANGLFMKKLMDKISAHPELAGKLQASYSDYKSLRFLLHADQGADAARVRQVLGQLYRESVDEFVIRLDEAKLSGLWTSYNGQISNPRTWFLSGTGASATEANMAARAVRAEATRVAGDGAAANVGTANFADHMAQFSQELHNLNSVRRSLAEIDVLRTSGIMAPIEGGQLVMSKNAIEIFRKIKRADFATDAAYNLAIRKRMKVIFGVEIDDVAVNGLSRYYAGIDTFSPPIFIEQRVPIDMSLAEHGLVSVDFAGIGVDNAHGAMAALARVPTEGVEANAMVSKAFRDVRESFDVVTARKDAGQARFNKAVRETLGEGPTAFSGDDGMFFPPAEVPASKRSELVARLAAENPQEFRMTFVNSHFPNGESIPATMRSQFVVKAENMEKALRKEITGVGASLIAPDRAQKMMIAVEFTPTSSAGNGTFNLIIGGEVSERERRLIQQALARTIGKEFKGSTAGTAMIAPAIAASNILNAPIPTPTAGPALIPATP